MELDNVLEPRAVLEERDAVLLVGVRAVRLIGLAAREASAPGRLGEVRRGALAEELEHGDVARLGWRDAKVGDVPLLHVVEEHLVQLARLRRTLHLALLVAVDALLLGHPVMVPAQRAGELGEHELLLGIASGGLLRRVRARVEGHDHHGHNGNERESEEGRRGTRWWPEVRHRIVAGREYEELEVV